MPAQTAPIRRKLMGMILLTSGVVLLITIASMFVYEVLAFRRGAVQQLHTLGAAIATNSTAALAFDDADDARAVLAAVQAEPHVVAVALYDMSGRLFAWYPSRLAPAALPTTPRQSGYRFEHGDLIGFEPVTQRSQRMGTLYIESNLDALYARIEWYALVAALVIVLCALVAYLMSHRLQRQFARPILQLAEAARAVSEHRDYAVRALPAGVRELDLLVDTFNEMLSQIRQSEHRLQAQLSRLSLLQDITRAIGDRQDLQSIFQVVLRTLEESLPIDFGCVCLQGRSPMELTVSTVGAASRRYCEALGLIEQSTLPVGQNGLSRCMAGELVYEPDVRGIQHPFPQRLGASGLRSLVIAPLLAEGTVFGVLLAARRQEGMFSSPDCEFLRQLSEHVALAATQAQLYGSLQQAYDDLRQSQNTVMQQERLRALGQMASGIAHDINNAISPVSLYTDALLEREPGISERGRGYLVTIQRAIGDVAGTVARMREFYRPRESQLTLTRIDVNAAVNQVLELTRPRWSALPQQRGIMVELHTQLADDLPQIRGAEGELRDALTNLVFNAVDAMPEGGTLTLRTRTGVDAHGNPAVMMEVSDSGIGMDEETRRRCLEPFFTTKGERGTGLGLAMVYGAVQRHSAGLEIDSAPGQGTTMRLIFPVYTAELEATASVSALPAAARALRILLVDDDPLLIKSLQDAFEGDGHAVVAATGGQAGIDAFAAAQRSGSPFEVVVTDLGMPHVDGRKVAAAVKSMAPRTPVILLTGWGHRLLAENDIPPNVDRVLNKPPRLQELRTALAELGA